MFENNNAKLLENDNLLQAAALANLDATKVAIANGADVHAQCGHGRTPLDMAQENNCAEAIQLLENFVNNNRGEPQIHDKTREETAPQSPAADHTVDNNNTDAVVKVNAASQANAHPTVTLYEDGQSEKETIAISSTE